jgi:hypothetical protein
MEIYDKWNPKVKYSLNLECLIKTQPLQERLGKVRKLAMFNKPYYSIFLMWLR